MDDNWPGLLPDAATPQGGMAHHVFGRWLDEVLRQQFAHVLDEPLPQALLDLIDADRPPAPGG